MNGSVLCCTHYTICCFEIPHRLTVICAVSLILKCISTKQVNVLYIKYNVIWRECLLSARSSWTSCRTRFHFFLCTRCSNPTGVSRGLSRCQADTRRRNGMLPSGTNERLMVPPRRIWRHPEHETWRRIFSAMPLRILSAARIACLIVHPFVTSPRSFFFLSSLSLIGDRLCVYLTDLRTVVKLDETLTCRRSGLGSFSSHKTDPSSSYNGGSTRGEKSLDIDGLYI